MSVGEINPVSALPGNNEVTQLESEPLGKDAFLKLLIAQFQNQDPLEPVSNENMILQLSQFSSIEATDNLNKNFESYLDNSNIATAASMMGKEVAYSEIVKDTDPPQIFNYIGTVDKVLIKDGKTMLEVDGREVEMSQIISVSEPPTAPVSP